MTIRLCIKSASLAVLFFAAPTLAQTPLGSVFTYQGQLKNAGSPANGSFNMLFTLWNDPTLSAPANKVGPTLTFDGAGGNPPPVSIVNGLFTVPRDFAAGAFDGNRRWLEISVSGTTLTPRQEVTAAPYALKSKSASALDAPDGNPLNAVSVDNDGNVGIGISNSAERLSVRDRIGVHEGTSGGAELRFRDGTALPNGLFRFRQNNGALRLEENTSGGGDFSTTNQILFADTGNVGVGTTSPQSRLHVGPGGGSATIQSGSYMALGTTSFVENLVLGQNVKPATFPTAGLVFMQDQVNLPGGRAIEMRTDSPGGILFHTTATGAVAGAAYSSEVMRITNSGNVGIRAPNPTQALEVQGQIKSRGAFSQAGTGALTYLSNTGYMYIGSESGSSTNGAGMTLAGAQDTLTGVPGGIRFNTTGVGTTSMVITSAGDVGIGTSGPAAKLHVVGTTRTSVLEITGADLAEKFPVSEEVQPGMVVAIDLHHPGQLSLARGAYNRCVAGVVSGANDFAAGAVLGNLPGHEDAPPIALSGRIYVWCDASSEAIQPGNLLTTSDAPGHAMKATDRDRSHGAIIGKAMTRLALGQKGLVLVLVNLQ